MTTAIAVLAVVTVLKVGAFPIARRVLSPLPFAGLGMSGTLGLLLVGVPLWLLATIPLISYTRLTAWLAVGALLVVGALLARRGLPRMTREHRRLVLVTEGVFLVAFGVALVVVSHVPDVWNGEKPLDMAMIQASLGAHHMPPPDPWISDQTLNYYYYFGQFLVSLVIRLAGVDSIKGYNVCIALIWALAASSAFGLGAMALGRQGSSRRVMYGAVAVCGLVVIGGNVSGLRHLFSFDGPLSAYPWFLPARVVGGAPNDFPVFQMILGELHAHVIAVPVMLLCVAFALQVLRDGPRVRPRLVVVAVSAGSLIAINLWTVPVVFGLLALAAVLSSRSLLRAALWFAALVVCACVIFSPYILSLSTAASSGIGIVHQRAGLGRYVRELLDLYGFALVAIVIALVPRVPRRWWPGIAAAGLAAVVAGVVSDAGSVVVLAAGLVVTILLLRREQEPPIRFGLLATAAGLACVLLPEVAYLRDGLNGTVGFRANTVFKFGASAFVLLGVGGGVLLAATVRRSKVWMVVSTALALGLLSFPLAGSWARTNGFRESAHLDGLRWLAAQAPGDPGAIYWLRRHAPRHAVLLEAVGPQYSPAGYGRMVVFTGGRSVVQRPAFVRFYGREAGVTERIRDVAAIYRTASPKAAQHLIDRYAVDFVVVGPLERQTYRGLDEKKFNALGREVYQQDGTDVYDVRPVARRTPTYQRAGPAPSRG